MNSTDAIVRKKQLDHLRSYLNNVDTEVTMILQNLQWDRKRLERRALVNCQYDTNHRVPAEKLEEHANDCYLKSLGYKDGDLFLPSPIDPDATTLVKLSSDDIVEIINNASQSQPLFCTGPGCSDHQPLTLERLQATYTTDERRAIHDAVVNKVPSCHDLSDLALPSSKDDVCKESKVKSKLEILAELRDMRRRRTKYRVAAKTRNYSDVLRDVITIQMELFTQENNSVNQAKQKSTTLYSDKTSNKTYHSNEIKTPRYIRDMCDISQHSRHHDKHKKERQNYSDHVYNSTRYSKLQECDESASSKTGQFKDQIEYDRKSKRNDEGGRDSAKSIKKRHTYDHYKNSTRYREIEYNCKGKIDANELTSNTTKHRTSHSYNSYVKAPDDNHGYQRYRSHRVKHDYDRDVKKIYNDDVDRQKRHKHKLSQIVAIKNEKDYRIDNVSNNIKNSGTDNSDTSHHSNVKKVKLEKEVYVKEENNAKVDKTDNDNPTANKDKRINKDRVNKKAYQQQEHKETVVSKIKLEKDKPLERRQHTEVTDYRSYKNGSDTCRSREDKYGRNKNNGKETIHSRH